MTVRSVLSTKAVVRESFDFAFLVSSFLEFSSWTSSVQTGFSLWSVDSGLLIRESIDAIRRTERSVLRRQPVSGDDSGNWMTGP